MILLVYIFYWILMLAVPTIFGALNCVHHVMHGLHAMPLQEFVDVLK